MQCPLTYPVSFIMVAELDPLQIRTLLGADPVNLCRA